MIDLPSTLIGLAALSEPLRARIEAELEPGERLHWAAVAGPKPSAALPRPAIPAAFGLVSTVLGIGFFRLGLQLDRQGPGRNGGGAVLLGLILLLIAAVCFLFAGMAWSARRKNGRADRRQSYALTDRRALVWEPENRAGGVEVFTIEPNLVRTVHRLEYPDGSGEVRIGFVADALGEVPWLPRSFVRVADVRRVEALARAVLIAQSLPTAPTSGPIRSGHINPFDPDTFEEPF